MRGASTRSGSGLRLALLLGNRSYPQPFDLPPIPKNLRDLEAVLARRGFEEVDPGRLSLAEQVALGAETGAMVGCFGAGMNLQIEHIGALCRQLKLDRVLADSTVPVIVKGVLRADDAVACVERGAAAPEELVTASEEAPFESSLDDLPPPDWLPGADATPEAPQGEAPGSDPRPPSAD